MCKYLWALLLLPSLAFGQSCTAPPVTDLGKYQWAVDNNLPPLPPDTGGELCSAHTPQDACNCFALQYRRARGALPVTLFPGTANRYVCHPIGDNRDFSIAPALGCLYGYQSGLYLSKPACLSFNMQAEDIGAAKRSVKLTRDTKGRLLSRTNADGQQWTASGYDSQGRPAQITDPEGVQQILTWEGTTTRLHTRTVGSYTYAYTWEDTEHVRTVALPTGTLLTFRYDQITSDVLAVSSSGPIEIDTGNQGATAAASAFDTQAAMAPDSAAAVAVPFPTVVPGPAQLAVLSFAVGFEIGTRLYPIIEPAMTKLVDTCTPASTPKSDTRLRCESAAYDAWSYAIQLCSDLSKKIRDPQQRKASFKQCEKNAMKVFGENLAACDRL